MTVVDASVVIKWFVEEPDSAAARDVLASDDPLLAPAHLYVEVGRGLLRRKRAGDLSASDAKLALAGLPAIVQLVPLDALVQPAFDIADACHVTIYDALYVALAEARGDMLVTADRRLCSGLTSTNWAGRAEHLRDSPASRREQPGA
ncbi:type II toxin-antitoxin system VapC family toxin [Chelatococcus sambhunathii]|uniref:Ribonuclease VapC n=1 Tax=Chelatococcus sambhunathii TaxID=363953 RepID=A0ABU1DAI8_9HYPH|nr:type II toxin-antitoxin system VapC family toxin [Chelatococcus sambhunathii]MDR4305059.1 type II toxin-antitoxin system VapC family toxin [Chelatococcus sambhunathii]